VNLRPTDVVPLRWRAIPFTTVRCPPEASSWSLPGARQARPIARPCDLLQLFVPVELLERLAGDYALPPFGVLSSPDPAVGRLALSLLAADELEGRAADLYSKASRRDRG
jgi:hypothetical protein